MSQAIQTAAIAILVTASLWLAAAGVLMVLRPDKALAMLHRTAATHRINITEQSLRMLAGIALIVRAPLTDWPQALAIGGWFIVATSALLLVIPLRWHAGYAIWWADRIPPMAVRFVAPFSIGAGLALAAMAL